MKIPAIFSGNFINKIQPLNEEQKKVIDIYNELFPSELARQTINAYCCANPADDTNFGEFWHSDTEKYNKWEELDKELTQKMSNRKWCLTIIGTVGNGKSTLACAFANSYKTYLQKKYKNLDVIYETFHSLLRTYKSKFDNEYFERICSCDLLVLDELTYNQRYTDFTEEIIGDLLVSRHSENKLTILIGNLSVEQFKSMFENQPHVLSRLREGYFYQMVGKDLRKEV